MKNLLFMLTFLIALPAAAYQAGPQNRTHFGATGQAQTGQDNYRSFSNYNNRSWGQGVQTHGVQTQVAGSSATDFEKKKPVGKAQASAPKPAAKPVQPAQPGAQAKPAQPGAQGQPAQADPAALMQQVQTMMNTMGAQTAQPGAVPNGAAQQAAQMPAGMPDISALMGGAVPAVPAANPTATPVKK